MDCPLCSSPGPKPRLRGNDRRRYYRCGGCELVFTDPRHRLSPGEERAHYLTHENGIDNAGYVSFLERLLLPLRAYLETGMRGLDYGCGPGPTLSRLLSRHGFACEDYDPLFLDRAPRPPYDFITATECLEHFHDPATAIRHIAGLLRPGGLLGVMTELWTTPEAFTTWRYTRDPTHVSFYHARTFDYLCEHYGFSHLWMAQGQVVILRRR